MDNGFMNRSTSATRMNAESSRSHCVIILIIQKEIPGGGKSRCAIKLVDLAGSEKTKKTQATGQRLEEAKAINQSLTSLGQVMVALGTPGGFIPYRNSKLTRLLQDALGGNSKTSLLIAASPCSYNCEETISALRFGERAKKVKNKPKMNEELTVDEYKKKVAKMEQKIKLLEKQNKLMKLQLEACMEWINGNGGNYDALIADVKIVEEADDDEKPPDVDFDSAQEISAQAFVIDKKSGKIVGGSAFSVSIGGTPADAAKNAADAAAASEDAKLEGLIRAQNDPNYGRGGGGGGGGGMTMAQMRMQDELADLRAESQGYRCEVEGLAGLLNETENKLKETQDDAKKITEDMKVFKMYKTKALYLEKHSESRLQQMQDDIDYLKKESGPGDGNDDLFTLLDSDSPAAMEAIKDKLRQLSMKAKKLEARNLKLAKEKKKLQTEGVGTDNMMDNLELGSDPKKKKALMKLMEQHKKLKGKLIAKEEEFGDASKQAALLKKREEYSKQLTKSWASQLEQMEKALVVCSQMHQKDREEHFAVMQEKQQQIDTFTSYIDRMTASRDKKKPAAGGRGGAAAAGGRGKKRSTKKRRASKNISAGNVAALST